VFCGTKHSFLSIMKTFIEIDGSEPVFASVLSAAERTGDFSELLSGPNPLKPLGDHIRRTWL
jgi:hypothetical protein